MKKNRELSEKEKNELVERASEVVMEKMRGWVKVARDKGLPYALSDAFLDGVQWFAARAMVENTLESLDSPKTE